MEFDTKYNRKPDKGESNNGIRVTERAGYIPPKKQIEDMIFAGQRLNQARMEQYDFPDENGTDDAVPDPTRAQNFDLADATALQRSAQNALKRQQEAYKASQIEKASNDTKEAEKAPEKPATQV